MKVEVRIEDPGDFEEVEIVEVQVAAGDAVAEGDVLLEAATDKANVDVVAPSAGTVAEVRVAAEDVVAADAVLVVIEA
jgi:pyruvate/2-oxoglutarate dehydrogenase complex dihydrolipoamide acyltransferase (E2) component